jgi:mRNA (2'-O-methyladenosine-N6-)-methyltransferase
MKRSNFELKSKQATRHSNEFLHKGEKYHENQKYPKTQRPYKREYKENFESDFVYQEEGANYKGASRNFDHHPNEENFTPIDRNRISFEAGAGQRKRPYAQKKNDKPIVGFENYYFAQDPKLRHEILDKFNLLSIANEYSHKPITDLTRVRDLKEPLTVPMQCPFRFREVCEDAQKMNSNSATEPFECKKIHFVLKRSFNTDVALGDCSYLDSCRHKDACKYVHY